MVKTLLVQLNLKYLLESHFFVTLRMISFAEKLKYFDAYNPVYSDMDELRKNNCPFSNCDKLFPSKKY